jgi:inhibitor of cysteine peptidase
MTASMSLADNGRSATLRVGEALTVALPENATTGYRWMPDAYDEALVAVSEGDPDYPTDAVGSGGMAVFTVRGVRPGRTELRFKHWRHWEGDASVIERFLLQVEIPA